MKDGGQIGTRKPRKPPDPDYPEGFKFPPCPNCTDRGGLDIEYAAMKRWRCGPCGWVGKEYPWPEKSQQAAA